MPLNLQQKQAVVSEVAEVASSAHSVIAAEYQGLTVAEMQDLRIAAREANVFLKVVKNTLARRAFDGTEFDCMGESLKGQLVFAFSMEEPGSAARVIKDFAGKEESPAPKRPFVAEAANDFLTNSCQSSLNFGEAT